MDARGPSLARAERRAKGVRNETCAGAAPLLPPPLLGRANAVERGRKRSGRRGLLAVPPQSKPRSLRLCAPQKTTVRMRSLRAARVGRPEAAGLGLRRPRPRLARDGNPRPRATPVRAPRTAQKRAGRPQTSRSPHGFLVSPKSFYGDSRRISLRFCRVLLTLLRGPPRLPEKPTRSSSASVRNLVVSPSPLEAMPALDPNVHPDGIPNDKTGASPALRGFVTPPGRRSPPVPPGGGGEADLAWQASAGGAG